MDISETIIKELSRKRAAKPEDLASLKRHFAKKFRLPCPPSSLLIKAYHNLTAQGKIKKNDGLARLLRTKKVRSLSGVVSVSVLTKPYPCPGRCLYCPTQSGLPKSYLRGEPAVMRALANHFDPYLQVSSRLKSLEATGHETGKIELIILGGTWSALPERYQDHFVAECFRAANEYGWKRKGRYRDLEKLQRTNEESRCRIIGITVETRPDFIDLKEIKRLRKLGVTRVEMGVQSLDEAVLRQNLRGHNVKETIRATQLLKDAGFKVCYHLMVNLPGSDLKKDKLMFDRVFKDPDFQPDFLKIYPCVVVKEAPLYRLWQKGRYQPYSDRQLIGLLARAKEKIPPYCRIIRIYRDIPSPEIMAGSQVSNLRQAVVKALEKRGKRCLCIRCREAKDGVLSKRNLSLFRQDYQASNGKEVFLSFEDKNRERLYSLLRLRLPAGDPVLPVLSRSALVREVHTYGQSLAISARQKRSPQHQGLGKKLMEEAEKIAKENGFERMAVIAGVGARDYYSSKLGYTLKDTYMVKNLG